MPNDVYFDSGLQGWIKSYSREQYWRVSRWYDLPDLVQDGYVCYTKCRNKYVDGPQEPGFQVLNTKTPSDTQRRHFMALVKRAFFNHIMTLSSNFAEGAVEDNESSLAVWEDGRPATLEDHMPAQQEELSVVMTMLNVPTEIGQAIKTIIDDGDGFLRSRLRLQDNGRIIRRRRAFRETSEERMARLTGDPTMAELVASYFVPVKRYVPTR